MRLWKIINNCHIPALSILVKTTVVDPAYKRPVGNLLKGKVKCELLVF
jgi:hypothetical protein